MKIEKLELYNFRSAKKVRFEFANQLNLFVGVNGAGKSTILDALSNCMSWLVKRIERDNGRGNYIADSSLSVGESEGFLNLFLNHKKSSYNWMLVKTAKGESLNLKAQLIGVSKLSEDIRKLYNKNMSLPIIAYYPVNRVVSAIRPEIPDKDSLYNLDIYENALGGKTNYQSFFEWFRLQDDILNAEYSSRTKWMRKNRTAIKYRINRIFDLLKKSFKNEFENSYDEISYLAERFEKDEMIYKEPRYLFRELSHIIEMISFRSKNNYEYDKILHDLEFMFHKMGSYSNEVRDNLIEEGGFHEEIVGQIIRNFNKIWFNVNKNEEIIDFLWEVFSFSLFLSLWWLSEKGRRNLDKELRAVKRQLNKIPSENSKTVAESLNSIIRQIIKKEVQQKKNAYRNQGHELEIVTSAIEHFIPDYNNLRVERYPRSHMLIDKNGETFDLDQLSDGEKNLIALVGDIARRLAIGNQNTNNPLKGDGVILIDEIDLHLHPNWQRLVVPKLLEVFPNCQFFISTHSPQVLSHVKPESVFLLEQTDEGLSYKKVDETYGMSLDRVVELIMNDEARPESVRDDLDKLFELIERKKIEEAKKLVELLKRYMHSDPDIMRAEMLIRQEEMTK